MRSLAQPGFQRLEVLQFSRELSVCPVCLSRSPVQPVERKHVSARMAGVMDHAGSQISQVAGRSGLSSYCLCMLLLPVSSSTYPYNHQSAVTPPPSQSSSASSMSLHPSSSIQYPTHPSIYCIILRATPPFRHSPFLPSVCILFRSSVIPNIYPFVHQLFFLFINPSICLSVH